MVQQVKLPEGGLDILLKEYASLKDEVKERLKTAFSHVAYVGGIVAFAIPAADKAKDWVPTAVPILMACAGALALLWVAFLNMRWVQHCGAYMKYIEDRVNLHLGGEVLGWERYAETVQAKLWFLIPAKASGKSVEHLLSMAEQGRQSDA